MVTVLMLLEIFRIILTLAGAWEPKHVPNDPTVIVNAGDSPWWLLFTTLGGVIVGSIVTHWLGERSAQTREQRSQALTRKTVRALLKSEIVSNSSALREYWSQLNASVPLSTEELDGGERALLLARKFSEQPLPSWSQLFLTSQAPYLAIALSDSETSQILSIYSKAVQLADYQGSLQSVGAVDNQKPKTREMELGFGQRTLMPIFPDFPDRASDVWPDIQALAESILEAEVAL